MSGTAGTIVATTFEGNATTATEATNVTSTANNSTNETVYPTFVDGQTGAQGIETDSGLTYNPNTGVLTASGGFSGVVTGTAQSAASLANPRTIGMTGDVVWTSAAFDGTANVTGTSTIQATAVEGTMLNTNVITGHSEITSSSGIDTAQDMVMVWDQNANALKKVKLDNLGISGTAVGSGNEIQYNNSNSFAAASNVEIKNNSLALKEQATPNATSGYGMVYAKTDNELYYRNDTNSEVKLTDGGAIAGGGAFRGIKAYLNADLAITTATSTTLGSGSNGIWSEAYDIGAFHGASPTNRFTFGGTGYYHVAIGHEWAVDSAGYREMKVTQRDVSGSTDIVLLTDRIVAPSNQATAIGGNSVTVYVDDPTDYLTVQLYQNSGANLNVEGGAVGSTFITITRLDMATQASGTADGVVGRVQLSDGSGGFTSDGDIVFASGTDTLTVTKLGAFTAAGAINFDSQNMTNVDIDSGDMTGVTISGALTWSAAQNLNSQALTNVNIDSGDISAATISGGLTWSSAQDLNSQALTNANIDSGDINSAVTINKSPVITLGGDLSGNATLTTLGNATLTATIAATSVEGSMLNTNVISGQTELSSGLATTDELMVSDAGTLKRMDMSVLYAATGTLTNKSIDLGTNTLTGSIAEFNTALQSESFATLGGTETLAAKTLTTPTISGTGFANANHTHAASNSGGQITLGSGTTGNYVATVAGTSNEVDVSASTGAVTIGLHNDVTIGNNLTVSGNLHVDVTTTTVNTTNLLV